MRWAERAICRTLFQELPRSMRSPQLPAVHALPSVGAPL
jgi:hypothetical protein